MKALFLVMALAFSTNSYATMSAQETMDIFNKFAGSFSRRSGDGQLVNRAKQNSNGKIEFVLGIANNYINGVAAGIGNAKPVTPVIDSCEIRDEVPTCILNSGNAKFVATSMTEDGSVNTMDVFQGGNKIMELFRNSSFRTQYTKYYQSRYFSPERYRGYVWENSGSEFASSFANRKGREMCSGLNTQAQTCTPQCVAEVFTDLINGQAYHRVYYSGCGYTVRSYALFQYAGTEQLTLIKP